MLDQSPIRLQNHRGTPILTYHSLDESGSVTSVRPRFFREHMRSLARRGFAGISLSELLDGWDDIAPLPARPVVLTFDDGFANLLEHAIPLLSELGFRATIFVVSGRCGQTNDWPNQAPDIPRLPLLSWSELAQMVEAGFEVGAHGVTHRPLTKLPQSEAAREIVESKAAIEDRLGQAVQTFAYPFGLFSRSICNVAREQFRAACTTKLERAKPTHDRHCLPRLDVYHLRRPILFRAFETLVGDIYLALRGAGREMRNEVVRLGFLRRMKASSEHIDGGC
ncbi:MAG TPA: polysaccharide deacetylase family protein [Chthoniobacterales bacterium]|nr:polysaccharide deacetylase family protein [Chthoniobacterales bacterium]